MAATQLLVGNYVIDRELGRGGMGVVYAATHRVLGRPAAIKLLADTAQDVERFFNEGRAAMAIEHPGVVRVYDVGRASDGRAYIAMELLSGESLAARLARGPLPVRVAVDFARQIAEALAAAHALAIVHRDLKPENVIVTGDRLKLVDFGVAKLAGPLAGAVKTVSGALIGTPVYMSPEQCEGLRELDARSDLYSLGCVMFAMLTGQPPFASAGLGALIGMHMYEPPPPLRDRCPAASHALEAAVARLLAKAPEDRYQTAGAVAEALTDPAVLELAVTGGAAATAGWSIASGTPAGSTAATAAGDRARGDEPTARLCDPGAAPQVVASGPDPRTAPQPTSGLDSGASSTAGQPPELAPSLAVTVARRRGGRGVLAVVALALVAVAASIAVVKLRDEPAGADVVATDAPPARRVEPPVDAAVVSALDAAPATVTITLAGAPANTEVRVNGALYGVAPRVAIPEGSREVILVLSRDGYRSASVPIVPDRDRRVDVRLVAQPRPLAPASDQPTNEILEFPK